MSKFKFSSMAQTIFSAMRIYGFLLFGLTLIQSIECQNVIVRDKSTGEPIDHVALYNQDKSASTLTDDLGHASIEMFGEKDSIYFQHPTYELAGYLKQELAYGDNRVMLEKRNIMLEEFVISAVKDRERMKESPYMIQVLKAEQLITSNFQTSADILQATGHVTVQKSQGGGGSPVLRGFEANKILLVIDGVRMNNAIYRSGHLQNSITIDNHILDRVEVLFGPSGIMYGSDALGGGIHYYTRDPQYEEQKISLFAQISSANQGKILHADFSTGGKKIASLNSFTFSDFGNTHSGRNRTSSMGDWGMLKHHVSQIGGVDSTLANPAPHIQKNTAYRQYDLLSKTRYAPSEFLDLTLNLQFSTSSNIDRFDMLNDYNGDDLKYAEWYYGPQTRFLSSVRVDFRNYNALYTNAKAILAFQRIVEDRNTRRFREDERMSQEEDVFVYSANLDFIKVIKRRQYLYYGLEFTHNDLRSQAFYENIHTGILRFAPTRYPDGGSHTHSLALYGNYKWTPAEKIILNAGFRYQYGILHSDFTDTNLPYREINIRSGAPTASVSLVYNPSPTWKYNFILATGFRIPNVDDYGKVRAKGDFITVPNENLKSEYTYNGEMGISKRIPNIATLNGSVWISYLTNVIVRTGHTVNGADTLFYDGDYYQIITNSNASLGTIQGISLEAKSEFPGNLQASGTFNFLRGRDITNNVPLAHIPPVFGKVSIRYFLLTYSPHGSRKFTNEAYIYYSGRKYWAEMSPLGEDNQEEGIQDFGYPAWFTLNLRSHIQLNEQLELQLAIENLLDRFYKTFSSGVGAPGRNFILTLRAAI